jgi:hypothetical protein
MITDLSVLLPGVDVEYGIKGLTRRRLEGVSGVVRGGNEGALPDVGRYSEEF